MRSLWVRATCSVLAILLGSYAFFRHARDWNTASRLILTYAMVDQGTVCLDGLNLQTGDIAFFQGHYYCDKLPGFSLAATVPYKMSRTLLGLPRHPLDAEKMAYWPADYWVTLGTSGLFTAFTAVLLMRIALELRCSPGRAALLGLVYGLATPAYVYATLAYGHQLTAFALLGSFFLLWKRGGGEVARLIAAGFLASYAAVIELQVGPVSAILGLCLLVQCLSGRRTLFALAYFLIGAIVPVLLLLRYNLLAFGSPWDMGYFHHVNAQFARVHNRQNPLGLRAPDLSRIVPLLLGEYRGLLFYAPILFLAIPGWILLVARRQIETAVVSLAIVIAVFLVNLSYPEWTGGWSTGPRLLVPLLPFAMIPVAAMLGGEDRWTILTARLAVLLGLAGGVLMLLFQGVGGRVPQDIDRPLQDFVWPLWAGRLERPGWWSSERFARNLVSLLAGDWLSRQPVSGRVLQFLPLVAGQLLAIVGISKTLGTVRSAGSSPPRSDLGVDQEQKRGRADQDAQDPEAKPHSMYPDPRP
jgi:hypothetical protein